MKRIFWATIICAVILSMTAPLVFAERESFFRLRDVPQSYVGEAGKTLVVKSTEDGLEYTTSPDYTTIDLTALNSTDGTDTTIIKHVQEPGLGGRLTFGLDETARTMVICDAGDVDTDLGLSIVSNPTLQFLKSDGSVGTSINYNDIFVGVGGYLYISGGATPTFRTYKQVRFHPQADLTASNYFTINSEAGIELTDTDSEQSWLYIEPKINQSATAGYNGLKIKVTETALGSAAAATDSLSNNLILAGTSTDPNMFKVQNNGTLYTEGGRIVKKTNVFDAAYGTSALTSDYIVAFLTLTAARTATISTEDEDSGTATQPRVMIFKDESGSAATYNITISLESGGTIDGAANFVIDQPYQSVTIYLNGTSGFVM